MCRAMPARPPGPAKESELRTQRSRTGRGAANLSISRQPGHGLPRVAAILSEEKSCLGSSVVSLVEGVDLGVAM